MRLPKSRGFKKHFKLVTHTVAINIGILNADDRIKSGDTISIESLATLGYAKRGHGFKILGNGEITKSITIQ
jgi:ribosomal protein L15